jgi:hypothetical protein
VAAAVVRKKHWVEVAEEHQWRQQQ